jgi:hypothetical protein
MCVCVNAADSIVTMMQELSYICYATVLYYYGNATHTDHGTLSTPMTTNYTDGAARCDSRDVACV